jgi:uncharacterized membrane protein YhaH (DUF805 family)
MDRQSYAIALGLLVAVGGLLVLFGFAVPIFALVAFYVAVCLASKRLHDANLSGALALIPVSIIGLFLLVVFWYSFLAFGNAICTGGSEAARANCRYVTSHEAVPGWITAGLFVLVGLIPGTQGENRYGESRQSGSNRTQPVAFCSRFGQPIRVADVFCTKCGARANVEGTTK